MSCLLNTCPYQHMLLAIANLSIASFHPNISIKSLALFIYSWLYSTHTLLSPLISVSSKFLPYFLGSTIIHSHTELLAIHSCHEQLPSVVNETLYKQCNLPHTLNLIQPNLVPAVTAASHPHLLLPCHLDIKLSYGFHFIAQLFFLLHCFSNTIFHSQLLQTKSLDNFEATIFVPTHLL